MRIRFEFIIILIAVVSLSFYMFGPISDDGVGAASRISPIQKSRVSAVGRYAVPSLAVPTNKTNITSPKIYIPSTTLCGDVNGDGRVATVDNMILSQVSAGLAILKPSYAECADVNRDGRIDTRDSLIVAQIVVGRARGNCPAGCRTISNKTLTPPPYRALPNATNTTNSTRTNTTKRTIARPIGQPVRLNMTINCTDTDGGNVPVVRGIVRAGSSIYTDFCHPTKSMYEFYCGKGFVNGTARRFVFRQDYYCPTACGGTPYCY